MHLNGKGVISYSKQSIIGLIFTYSKHAQNSIKPMEDVSAFQRIMAMLMVYLLALKCLPAQQLLFGMLMLINEILKTD